MFISLLRWMLVALRIIAGAIRFVVIALVRVLCVALLPFSQRAIRLGWKYDLLLAWIALMLSSPVRQYVGGTDWLLSAVGNTVTWFHVETRIHAPRPWMADLALGLLVFGLLGLVYLATARAVTRHPHWVPTARRDAHMKIFGAQEQFPAREFMGAIIASLTGTLLLPGVFSLVSWCWFVLGLYWLRTSQRGGTLPVVVESATDQSPEYEA